MMFTVKVSQYHSLLCLQPSTNCVMFTLLHSFDSALISLAIIGWGIGWHWLKSVKEFWIKRKTRVNWWIGHDEFVSLELCLITLYGWAEYSVSLLEFFCKLSFDFLNGRGGGSESDWTNGFAGDDWRIDGISADKFLLKLTASPVAPTVPAGGSVSVRKVDSTLILNDAPFDGVIGSSMAVSRRNIRRWGRSIEDAS